MGRRRFIILTMMVIILVLVLAAGAFLFLSPLRSPKEVVAAATKKIDVVKSTHFTMRQTISTEDQKMTIDASGDMIIPDKLHMTGKMTSMGLETELEEIIIGDEVYMRMPQVQDDWMAIPTDLKNISQQGMGGNVEVNDFLKLLEAVAEIEDLGDEAVKGKDCRHFAIDVDEEKLVSLLVKEQDDLSQKNATEEMFEDSDIGLEVWIGKNDDLLYKEEVKMEIVKPTDMTVEATIEFSDFNKQVTIEAPEGAVEY